MMYSIPKEVVAGRDEGGGPVEAAVGDQVDLVDVVAMITGEEGDNFTVEIKSVNGHMLAGDPEAAPAADEASLLSAMESMDSEEEMPA
jgi:hypothetical protein